jgi:hypothetical protein
MINELIDLVVKCQGLSDLILIADTPSCPNTNPLKCKVSIAISVMAGTDHKVSIAISVMAGTQYIR